MWRAHDETSTQSWRFLDIRVTRLGPASVLVVLGLVANFSLVLFPSADANHVTCSTQSTHVTTTWNPVQGVSVSIVSIACGTLDTKTDHFKATHHQVECAVGGSSLDSFSFDGSFTYTGVTQRGGTSYTSTNTTSVCLPIINSRDFGPFQKPKQPENVFTDFAMAVTYLPSGAQNTLIAAARDCAVSSGQSCPAIE